MLPSFASVGMNLTLSLVTSLFRILLLSEIDDVLFLLGIICILPSRTGLCLQRLAHPTVPKLLPSALRPHDQIFTLPFTSVGLLLPSK